MSKKIAYVLTKPSLRPCGPSCVYDELCLRVDSQTITASKGDLVEILLGDKKNIVRAKKGVVARTIDVARILFFVGNKDESESPQKYVFVQWIYPEKHVVGKYMLSNHYDILPVESINDVYSKMTAVRLYSDLFFNHKTKRSRRATFEDLLLFNKKIQCWTMYTEVLKSHAVGVLSGKK